MRMITPQIVEYAIVAVVVLSLAAVAMVVIRLIRSRALEHRYGSEYERTLNITGSRRETARELRKREERVRRMNLTELPNSQKFRYAAEWRSVQGSFVDEPRAAVKRADALIANVMRERGYTSDDFDQRVEDLSPNHPAVLDQYRQAHAIAERAHTDGTSTEELRRAVVAYRATFDELVGQPRRNAHV